MGPSGWWTAGRRSRISRQALELTTDAGRYAEIAAQLAWLLTMAARTEEAVATAEQALSRLGDRERDLRRRLEATILLAGHHDPARAAVCERVAARVGAVDHEEGLGARRVQALLLTAEHRGEASAGEVATRAERLLADGLALREDNGRPGFMMPVRILIESDCNEAIVWLDRGLEQAREEGDAQALSAQSDVQLPGPSAPRGAGRRGAGRHRGGRGGVGAMGSPSSGRASQAGFLAGAQIEAGDLDGAERTLARVAPLDRQTPDMIGWHAFTFMTSHASLLLARGDPRGSLELAIEAARRFEPRSRRWIGWRSHAALCLTALGEEPERAVRLVEEDVQLARRWGAPGALGAALRTRGLVLGDQDGEDSLREAVNGAGRVDLQARACQGAGRAGGDAAPHRTSP